MAGTKEYKSLEKTFERYGVKFIDSSFDGIRYAIDNEQKGIVIIRGNNKIGFRKNEIRKVAEELKGIYEAFLKLRM